MTFSARILTILLTAGLATSALAEDDPTATRYAAVAGLGTLNGTALQCRYLDEVRRLKAAVVEHAPKERSYGLAFESATNEAFLAFRREAAVCPSPAAFRQQVDEGIRDLGRVFSPNGTGAKGVSRQ